MKFVAALAMLLIATTGAFAQLTRLTHDTTVYVDCATGNDANDGSTPALAIKSSQAAVDYVWSNYFLDGWSVFFQFLDGDQRPCGGAIANAFAPGQAAVNRNVRTPFSESVVRFKGNPSNVNAVKLLALIASDGASFSVESVTFDHTGFSPPWAYNALKAEWSGLIFFRNINCGPVTNACLQAQNYGYIQNYGNYQISGGSSAHVGIGSKGIVFLQNAATITNNPTFPNGFANISQGAEFFNAATFSGSVTANKCSVTVLSSVYGSAALPGAAGTCFADSSSVVQ